MDATASGGQTGSTPRCCSAAIRSGNPSSMRRRIFRNWAKAMAIWATYSKRASPKNGARRRSRHSGQRTSGSCDKRAMMVRKPRSNLRCWRRGNLCLRRTRIRRAARSTRAKYRRGLFDVRHGVHQPFVVREIDGRLGREIEGEAVLLAPLFENWQHLLHAALVAHKVVVDDVHPATVTEVDVTSGCSRAWNVPRGWPSRHAASHCGTVVSASPSRSASAV